MKQLDVIKEDRPNYRDQQASVILPEDIYRAMDQPSVSLFSRVVSRRRPLWVTAGVSLLLILIPIAAARLDGSWDLFVSQGY